MVTESSGQRPQKLSLFQDLWAKAAAHNKNLNQEKEHTVLFSGHSEYHSLGQLV